MDRQVITQKQVTSYRLTFHSWMRCSCLMILITGLQAPIFAWGQSGNSASFTIPKRDDPNTMPENSEPENRYYLREERIRSIQHRIETLKEVLTRREEAPTGSTDDQADIDRTSKPVANVSPEIDQKLRKLASQEPFGGEESVEAQIDLEESNHSAAESRGPAPEGIPIITSPVNSFELANSLFLTGNYTQALRSYEDLMTTKDKIIDQDWLRLHAANCNRIQKKFGTAEQLYRDVTASKEKSYPSDHARWYLNYLTRRRAIETELQTFDSELNALIPNKP